jgi:hypothetical protein
VLGDKLLKAIEKVPLLNSAISRRIEGINCNIECELIHRINTREFFFS